MTKKAERAKDDTRPSRWQRRQQGDASIDPPEDNAAPKGPIGKHKKGERLDNQENPQSRWWGRWRS